MQLVLTIGNKVLDIIAIDPKLAKDDDFLCAMKRLLIAKHELAIIAHQQEPVFYLQAPSKINGQETSKE
jgi:hypothetical protein